MKEDVTSKSKYEFDIKTGIFFKFYYGKINLDDITTSWNKIFEKKVIPKTTKGFILDYRDASFNLDVDKYVGISDFYQENIEIFRNFKIAILTDNHKDIVIPILVKTKDKDYTSKPFSTIEAAINWVLG